MKTTLELLIDEFQELKKTKLYQESFKAIDDCINLAYANIETEKQQIINASAIAHEDMFGSDGTKYGEDYYNNTFKKK